MRIILVGNKKDLRNDEHTRRELAKMKQVGLGWGSVFCSTGDAGPTMGDSGNKAETRIGQAVSESPRSLCLPHGLGPAQRVPKAP